MNPDFIIEGNMPPEVREYITKAMEGECLLPKIGTHTLSSGKKIYINEIDDINKTYKCIVLSDPKNPNMVGKEEEHICQEHKKANVVVLDQLWKIFPIIDR